MNGLTVLELQRAARIEENQQRMRELGLVEEANKMKASQQASQASRRGPAAAKPRAPRSAQFVDLKEEDLRRSGRSKKDVNYNEHIVSKLAEQALRVERRSRTYRVKKSSAAASGGTGRNSREWLPSMGIAGYAAQEECEEAARACMQGLANPATFKLMTKSMVSGGFWCSAPKGLRQLVAVTTKCTLTAYLPPGQEVPEGALNVNPATNGWDIVWLPHGKDKRDYGFSGNWVGFACDNKLFPGDFLVAEVLPEEEHRRRQQQGGGEPTTFGLVFHVFRAMEFETAGARQARLAAVEEEEEEEEEGEPAAVQAAAAELSQEDSVDDDEEEVEEEVEEEEEETAQAAVPKRKRQAQLTSGASKRQKHAGPAAKLAPSAKAGVDNKKAAKTSASKAAASKAASSKAAPIKGAAAKKMQQQGKTGRAPASKKAATRGKAAKVPAREAEAAEEVEEEVYWVERILAVAGEGEARTFHVK